MNPAYIWLIVAAAAFGVGATSLASSADQQRYAKVILLVLGSVLQSVAVSFAWYGQQLLLQQANSVPVVESRMSRNKVLTIRNVGRVDVEDVEIEATQYVLRANRDAHGHSLMIGIESFSRIGKIPQPYIRIAVGDHIDINLLDRFENKEFMPFYEGFPAVDEKKILQQYCLRIKFRNATTKKREIDYLITPAVRQAPPMFENFEGSPVGVGGGYESSMALFRVKRLIREHQGELYDDNPQARYWN